jgi:hypothetical protein
VYEGMRIEKKFTKNWACNGLNFNPPSHCTFLIEQDNKFLAFASKSKKIASTLNFSGIGIKPTESYKLIYKMYIVSIFIIGQNMT